MRAMSIATIVLLASAAALPAQAQTGQQLVVTLMVAGTIQDQGGVYYLAFSVSDALLAGPQPDSTNWTHYVVYREGRFFFGVVPPTTTQPFGFTAIRPPAPFIFGQVLGDRKGLRVSVPLTELRVGPALPTRVMINFVIVDPQNRPLDALGPGANDRLGFVTLDLRRDLYKTVRDPRGDQPDPNYDILGGEIRVGTP